MKTLIALLLAASPAFAASYTVQLSTGTERIEVHGDYIVIVEPIGASDVTAPTPVASATPPDVAMGRVVPLDKAEGMEHPSVSWGVLLSEWDSIPNWQNTVNQIVLLRYVTGATYGQTVTVVYTIKAKIDFGVKDALGKLIANLKLFRLWPASGGNYVNVYEGQSPGDPNAYLHAENMTAIVPAGSTVWAANHRQFNYAQVLKMFDGQPHAVVRQFTYPSALGKNDGKYKVTVDGATAIDLPNWQMNCAAYPSIPNVVNLQLDISNHKQPADAFVTFTNVVVTVR